MSRTMSDVDQEPEDNRHRRLLCRALVITGAAAAGTAVIWLAGGAASAESSEPAPALVEGSTAASSGAERSAWSGRGEAGPEAFRFEDLDPARLLLDPSQPSDANAVEVVAAPVGGLLREAGRTLTSPVRDIGEALPRTLHNGLDGVGRPLLRAVTNAPAPAGALPGVVDPPHVGDTPSSPVGPPPAAPAQLRSAVGTDVGSRAPDAPGAQLTAAGPGALGSGAPRSEDEPRAFARPATIHTTGATGSAGATDWPGQGAELQGRSLQAANLGAVPRAGLGHTTRIPAGRPPAQPGTTPD